MIVCDTIEILISILKICQIFRKSETEKDIRFGPIRSS